MRQAFEVLERISLIGSRNEKIRLLKENQSEDMKFILETFLNPYWTYGVKDFDDDKVYRTDIPLKPELFSLREALIKRELTGNEARECLKFKLLCEDVLTRKWLIKMFRKDLRAGFTGGTVNKVYPDLIPEFQIGLCGGFSDKEKMLPNGEWFVEPKLDGIRCLAFITALGEVAFVSRNNKDVWNTELIEAEIKKAGVKDVVLDGELLADTWDNTISIAHTQSDVGEWLKKKLKFYIFDMLTDEEWEKKDTVGLVQRKQRLENAFGAGGRAVIGIVYGERALNFEDAEGIYKEYLKQKYEGVVIKRVDSKYPFKRGEAWLKWKPISTFDVQIVGYAPGSGRNKDVLGAFICEFKGKKIHVGGGYSDEQRKKFWEQRDEMIGKVIEIEGQEVTKYGAIRFPVFVRLREDKII